MSYSSDYRTASTFDAPSITWGVQRLICVTAAVFALQLILAPALEVFFPSGPPAGVMPGGRIINDLLAFHPSAHLLWHPWTPLTYMFLHHGLMHMFFNMLWLYFFGCEVERTLGTRQFLRFYILCGALGVMATFVLATLQGDFTSVIGASGATMGVLVAFAMIDPERQIVLFPIPFPLNARAIVFIVVFMNIISGLGDNTVSVATHFGGLITGFLYMKFAPEVNRWVTRRRGGRTSRKPADPGKVGEAVDNIFKLDNKRRR